MKPLVEAVLVVLIAVTALTLAPALLQAVSPEAIPPEIVAFEEAAPFNAATLPPTAVWKIVAGALFLWGLRVQSHRR